MQPPVRKSRLDVTTQAIEQCEQDFAFTTRWLEQASLPDAAQATVDNVEHFLDWRWDANRRYEKSLRLFSAIQKRKG